MVAFFFIIKGVFSMLHRFFHFLKQSLLVVLCILLLKTFASLFVPAFASKLSTLSPPIIQTFHYQPIHKHCCHYRCVSNAMGELFQNHF